MIVKMMVDRVGYYKAIEEAKNEWLENLLLFLEIDIHKLQEQGSAIFTEYLSKNKIEIIDYLNLNAIAVRQSGELVGEWTVSDFILKKDKKTGGLYYELEIESWSVIEENIGF